MSDVPTGDSAGVQRRFPATFLTPTEFEKYITELFRGMKRTSENFRVTHRERIETDHGTYEIDAVVRFRFADLDFVVLVEAKRHKNPIKRELVQVLYQKLLDTGAQKAVLFATANFQSGAIEFAKAKGVALIYISSIGLEYVTDNLEQRTPDMGFRLPAPASRVMWVMQGGRPDNEGQGFAEVDHMLEVWLTEIS